MIFIKMCSNPLGKTIVRVVYKGQIKYLPLNIVEGDNDTIFIGNGNTLMEYINKTHNIISEGNFQLDGRN